MMDETAKEYMARSQRTLVADGEERTWRKPVLVVKDMDAAGRRDWLQIQMVWQMCRKAGICPTCYGRLGVRTMGRR